MKRYGIDITRFGRLFAERVLKDGTLQPERLPELSRLKSYREQHVEARMGIDHAIREEAGKVLVAAGHCKAKVRRVLRLN